MDYEWTANPRAILEAIRQRQQRQRELHEACARALRRRAQVVAANAAAKAPRHLRGRLSKLIKVHDVANNLEELAAYIESGGGNLKARVFAIHGTERNYSRGTHHYLRNAYLDEVRTWPEGFAKAVRRELPRGWTA